MRNIIVSEFVTLDGVMEAPGGEKGHPHSALMEHDLVDEHRLMVFPVVLGSGRRLFPESQDKVVLKLSDARTSASGVVVHTDHPDPTRK